jgi:hypothetical protein
VLLTAQLLVKGKAGGRHSLILLESDIKRIKNINNDACKLINSIDDNNYEALMSYIYGEEKRWVAWKERECPDLELPPPSAPMEESPVRILYFAADLNEEKCDESNGKESTRDSKETEDEEEVD